MTFRTRTDIPTDILPASISPFADDLADLKQVPREMVVLSVLATASMAIHAKAKLQLRSTWREPLPLWMMLSARPGARKSPVFNRCLRPYRRYLREETEAREAYFLRLEDAKEASLGTGGSKAEVEAAFKAALPPTWGGTGLHAVLPVVSDATPEAIAMACAGNCECVYVATAEASGAIAIMNGLYSTNGGQGANLGLMLSGYSGDFYVQARVTRAPVILHEPSIGLFLMGQPSVLRDFASNQGFTDLGVGARMLLFDMPDNLGTRAEVDRPEDAAATDTFDSVITQIASAPWYRLNGHDAFPAFQGDIPALPTPWPRQRPAPWILRPSDAAHALHVAFCSELEPQMTGGGLFADCDDFASKLAGNAGRVAAALHALEHPAEWWRTPVSEDTMARAIELARAAAGFFLQVLHADDVGEEDDRATLAVMRKIADTTPNHGEFRLRQLRSTHSGTRSIVRDAGELQEIVHDLVGRKFVIDKTPKLMRGKTLLRNFSDDDMSV